MQTFEILSAAEAAGMKSSLAAFNAARDLQKAQEAVAAASWGRKSFLAGEAAKAAKLAKEFSVAAIAAALEGDFAAARAAAKNSRGNLAAARAYARRWEADKASYRRQDLELGVVHPQFKAIREALAA